MEPSGMALEALDPPGLSTIFCSNSFTTTASRDFKGWYYSRECRSDVTRMSKPMHHISRDWVVKKRVNPSWYLTSVPWWLKFFWHGQLEHRFRACLPRVLLVEPISRTKLSWLFMKDFDTPWDSTSYKYYHLHNSMSHRSSEGGVI